MDRGLQISEVHHFLKNKMSLLYSEELVMLAFMFWGGLCLFVGFEGFFVFFKLIKPRLNVDIWRIHLQHLNYKDLSFLTDIFDIIWFKNFKKLIFLYRKGKHISGNYSASGDL